MTAQHAFILMKIETLSLLCLLTWRYDNVHYLKLSLSRTYFHGSKGVRAIEVLLYFGEALQFTKLTMPTLHTQTRLYGMAMGILCMPKTTVGFITRRLTSNIGSQTLINLKN